MPSVLPTLYRKDNATVTVWEELCTIDRCFPNNQPLPLMLQQTLPSGSLDRLPSFADLLSTVAPRPVRQFLGGVGERLLGIHTLNNIYQQAQRIQGDAGIVERILAVLQVDCDCSESDLARIPNYGPTVVVANHPYGAIEALTLSAMLRRVRPDVKIIANYLLQGVARLREHSILVDPFGSSNAARTNVRPLREAFTHLRNGGMVVVFPAGEVSSYSPALGRVTDPEWNTNVARLIQTTGAATLPVFVRGHNGTAFQAMGMIHPTLRTALLPRQLLRHRGTSVQFEIGNPIPARRLADFTDETAITTYLRHRTYLLEHRTNTEPQQVEEVRSQRWPTTIIPAVPQQQLVAEVAGLDSTQLLLRSNEMEVWIAQANQMPMILREIGRLREITFRAVGEGTGGELDLDEFDHHYHHLFVWNSQRKELVGAYRIGHADMIRATHGKKGLYTQTLFRMDDRLLDDLGVALELGRAFVRPEYQRTFPPLMLLWKGISEYVARNPQYRTLFGPISISNDYNSVSRTLMVRFLETHHTDNHRAEQVRPRSPYRAQLPKELAPSHVHRMLSSDVEELSRTIMDIEGGKRDVPVLLRQYLKLGARIIAFNIDPAFGNALDGLMTVDLAQTDPRILARYMRAEGSARFLAEHAKQKDQPSGTSLSRAAHVCS